MNKEIQNLLTKIPDDIEVYWEVDPPISASTFERNSFPVEVLDTDVLQMGKFAVHITGRWAAELSMRVFVDGFVHPIKVSDYLRKFIIRKWHKSRKDQEKKYTDDMLTFLGVDNDC